MKRWSWAALVVVLLGSLRLAVAHSDDLSDNARNREDGHRNPARDVCVDSSAHWVRQIEVEPGVWLEVLDWGGNGDALVLLAGLGASAHVFDDFAYQFTDRFRVLGITRRGYGRSSKPAAGYDIATRVNDDLKVLDHLGIARAVFVGHSVAGVELSRLGALFPDRVRKLVYLDAYDYGVPVPEPAPGAEPPGPSKYDASSPLHYEAYTARTLGVRKPVADTCNVATLDRNGRLLGTSTPPEIFLQIYTQSGAADFARVTVPALGIFAYPQAAKPYSVLLAPEAQLLYQRNRDEAKAWQQAVLQRMLSGMPKLELVILPDVPHDIYISNEAEVVQRMRAFLLEN